MIIMLSRLLVYDYHFQIRSKEYKIVSLFTFSLLSRLRRSFRADTCGWNSFQRITHCGSISGRIGLDAMDGTLSGVKKRGAYDANKH